MITVTSHKKSSARPIWTIAALHAMPRWTIAVTARTGLRFSRLKVRYPHHSDLPRYDSALASELLDRTSGASSGFRPPLFSDGSTDEVAGGGACRTLAMGATAHAVLIGASHSSMAALARWLWCRMPIVMPIGLNS